ncbi:hypothetical protein ACVGVM_24670 [Pseudonocardia bannensis]|uniref:Uncharacterized protein n=1 Tax=Pseudonocardia bannensis TaxID=630973 RepID=A0A848DD04_9PSEU|nr:hypothetical protein [Pseudonocardia bannensis]NMH90463.1 hypothetical protein [Pseudonocardia bannensis]
MRTLTDHSPVPPAADPLTRIAAALDDTITQIHVVIAIPHGTNTHNAHRAALLARLHARQAGWWQLLARAAVTDLTRVHPMYMRAALRAAHKARDDARFWRDVAADWTARAEHRPTSDAAGALSSWDELGVTA